MIHIATPVRLAAVALGSLLIAIGSFKSGDAEAGDLPATVPGSKPTPGCRIDYSLPGGVKRSGDPCEVRVDPRGRLSVKDAGGGCGINRACPLLTAHVALAKGTLSLSSRELTDGKWLLYVGDSLTQFDCFDTPAMHGAQGSGEIQITSVDPPHGSVRAKVDCVPNVPGQGRKTRDSLGAQATIEIVF